MVVSWSRGQAEKNTEKEKGVQRMHPIVRRSEWTNA